MTTTTQRLGAAAVGTSGFAYPSWKPGFYPARAQREDFLRLYAERLPSVELNTTGYRLPSEESFRRWAEQTPGSFRFAVKLPGHVLRSLGTFVERVSLLGERLGVLRVVVMEAADPGLLALLLGSLDPSLRVALDCRHPSWGELDVRPAVRVNDWEVDAPFRYLRFREPPYADDDLVRLAGRLRALLESGIDVYAYFRHEDEPTAPRYAERLLALLA